MGSRVLRIALLLLASPWLFPVSCTANLGIVTLAISYYDARDVADGDEVHSVFSVVSQSEAGGSGLSVLGLHDVERLREMEQITGAPSGNTYLMSAPAGHKRYEDGAEVSFRVLEDSGDRQRIEVVWQAHDGDNTVWSVYDATDTTVTPVSTRMFYFGYSFAAFPIALVLSFALYGLARLFLKRMQPQTAESDD